jgi:hypothetical protein
MRKHIFTALHALPPAMPSLAQYHSENLFSISRFVLITLIDLAVARKRPIDRGTGVSRRTHTRRQHFFYPNLRFFAAFIK